VAERKLPCPIVLVVVLVLDFARGFEDDDENEDERENVRFPPDRLSDLLPPRVK